jgi:hypothetical protein
MTMKRVMQPRSVRISADPSGTNLITRRNFSYKVDTAKAYNSTSLQSNYPTVFPDLTQSQIRGVRIDRISVWGSDTGGVPENVFLSVGKFYSQKDVGGLNQRARLCCLPRLYQGECDETTLIRFEGALHLHIVGVVYLEREGFPGAPATSSAQAQPQLSAGPTELGKLPMNGHCNSGSAVQTGLPTPVAANIATPN